mmetsp:Transcript_69551/g.123958  ORF Transcript_69551/g.123958 Transcript_69551/m.123958 type:complete len:198 (-) Transcript_69551:118-711(-)
METSDTWASGTTKFPQRSKRIYDQAVTCTHDRSAMRSEMTAWRVPKTGDTQRMLHTTSQIIDTDIRQRATRDLQHWLKEKKEPGSSGLVFHPGNSGGGFQLTSSGTLPRSVSRGSQRSRGSNRSLSTPALPTPEQPLQPGQRPYLPPWVTAAQWDQVVQSPPPRWLAPAYAIAATGPGHWAGAAVPPSRGMTPARTR